MAYDESVAARVRAALKGHADVAEKKMFGGIAFLLRGHMVCGVLRDDLVLRLGDAGAEAALREPHTRPMDFTGKPIRSMLFVRPEGYASGAALHDWLRRALDFAESLPPKDEAPEPRATRRRRSD